jgi:hypothetical protein
VIGGDRGQQPPVSGPPLDRLAALSKVVIDDQDPLASSAQLDGAVGRGVLAGGRPLMVGDLLGVDWRM